jgi:cytosine/adenosine deaminase-related metal-dependent hydrolase
MLDDAEMKQFHDNGIGIAHCPSSNLRLASGMSLTLPLAIAAVGGLELYMYKIHIQGTR